MIFNNLPDRLLLKGWPRLAALTSLLILLCGKTDGRVRRWYFQRMVRRLQKMGCKHPGQRDYPVYVINRKKDTNRLCSFQKAAAKQGIQVIRFEAVDVNSPDFPWAEHQDWIGDKFHDSEYFPKGPIGCSLSHISLWKKVAHEAAPGALICEDDAVIVGPLPKKWDDYKFPVDADFVFASKRMAEGLFDKKSLHRLQKKKFSFIPFSQALETEPIVEKTVVHLALIVTLSKKLHLKIVA